MELRIYFFRYRNNNCGGTTLIIPGVSLSNLGTYSIYKIIIIDVIMYWTGENRIQNTDLVQTSRFTAFNANRFGTCKMRRLNRTLILSFTCIIINISINCKQQDDNFLRSFKSVLFYNCSRKTFKPSLSHHHPKWEDGIKHELRFQV